MTDKFSNVGTEDYRFGVQYWDANKRRQPNRWFQDSASMERFVAQHAVKDNWSFWNTGSMNTTFYMQEFRRPGETGRAPRN